jgi:hypothetical protein
VKGVTSQTFYYSYSVLKSIEAGFGLPCPYIFAAAQPIFRSFGTSPTAAELNL